MRFTDEVSVYNTKEIERRLITSDTKFEVLRGYIGAIITEAEIDELRNGDKTMYSRLAGSEMTIDGLTRQFSEMETSYDALSGEYSTLNTRTLQIQETVSGVITTVSEVKTTAEGADTKVTNLAVTVNGVSSRVEQAKTEAIAEAGTATDNKLKNYKKTTELMSYINQQSGSINLGVIKNSSTLATNSGVATAKNEAISAANSNTANLLKSYTKTADLTIDIDGIRTKVTEASIDLTGTKNAAVTAAGEATDAKLKDYKKTSELMSYINQQSGSINLGVIKNSSTLATNSGVATAKNEAISAANSNTANLLKSYTKTADLTIDIDGISTKVTEANVDLSGTQQAAETAAKNYTDRKLQDYTKTESLISYINQKSGSINLGVIKNSNTLATTSNVDTAKSEAISSANTNTTNQLKSYTKTADLKISIDGVKMQFADANIDLAGTKKEATSAAKSYTDSQLGDYTKTKELISYINLQSGRIALGVIDGSANLATKSNVATAKSEAISSANTNTTNTLKNYATKAYADQAEEDAKTYADSKVKPATIVAEINKSGSSIQLNANKINMDADTLNLWGNDIRLQSSNLSWNSTNSSMTENGNLWVASLNATKNTQVKGSTSSYFKMSDNYSTGYVIDTTKQYAALTVNGLALSDGVSFNAYYRYHFAKWQDYNNPDRNASITSSGLTCSEKTNFRTSLSSSGIDIYFGSGASYHSYFRKDGFVCHATTKSRAVKTQNYGTRLQYCYEMPSPSFGDIGEGVIAEDGYCYIQMDPIFLETIAKGKYQVFLQPYGEGKLYVKFRNTGYFVVAGTPGLTFAWEVKAKQADTAMMRMEDLQQKLSMQECPEGTDYAAAATQHINDIDNIREVA